MASEKIPKSTNERSCHLTTTDFSVSFLKITMPFQASVSHTSWCPCFSSLLHPTISSFPLIHMTFFLWDNCSTISWSSTPANSSKTHASLRSLSCSIKFTLLHLHEILPSASQVLQIRTHHKTSPKHLPMFMLGAVLMRHNGILIYGHIGLVLGQDR